MLTFEQLMQDVGAWAAVNFEQSWCEELPLKGPGSDMATAGLGSLGPLLGIGEEIGELNDAIIKADGELVRDSIGDILIYLCDWCYREKLPFPVEYSMEEGQYANSFIMGLSASYGQMCHCKLKRCQKIRGMDTDGLYQGHMYKAMCELMSCLMWVAQETLKTKFLNDPGMYDLLKIANDTWNNVVSKRDWKAWPRAGSPTWLISLWL